MSEDTEEKEAVDETLDMPSGGYAAELVPGRAQSGMISGSQIVAFRKGIEIDGSKRLPDLDVGEVKAYQATNPEKKITNLVAYVCEKHLIPRTKASSAYQNLSNPSLLLLIDEGVVYWPAAREERYVFVYSQNIKKRVSNKGGKHALGLRQDIVMDTVITPMISVMQDFRDRHFFHGYINAQNLFYLNVDDGKDRVTLGDCLTVPPGYYQHPLYETIERAAMDPIAKGRGDLADDLYAFGVMIGVLIRHNDPLEGFNVEEIIQEKIEHGSYIAITGKDRFKGSTLELLRGLLQDDPTQRWTIDEVLSWHDGLRLSPKQAVRQKKAARPLSFLGNKYFQLPVLAMDLDKNTAETLKMYENGDLMQWLTRAIEDDELVERVEAAERLAKHDGSGSDYADKFVACLALALNPRSAIRFKGHRMGGDGVGNALAHTMVSKKNVKPFVELFMQNVAMNWLNVQEIPNLDIGLLASRYENCRKALRQTKPGFGIERCLYILCPEMYCLSEKFKDYYVVSSGAMIRAFEDLCEKGNAPHTFLDRHSIAFLSVRDAKCVDAYLYDLGLEDPNKKALANLKCLGTIQKRSEIKSLPHIAKAFAKHMPAIYKQYHDKEIIEKIDKSMRRYIEAGDLVKMAGLLDNVTLLNQDNHNFRIAQHEYNALVHEAYNLAKRLEQKHTFGRATGRRISSIISAVISCVIIVFLSIIFLTGKANF